jgi:hypothetical protein
MLPELENVGDPCGLPPFLASSGAPIKAQLADALSTQLPKILL